MTSEVFYNPNVPEKASSSLAESQGDFLDNFSSLYNTFLVNHVPLDAVSGAGNHTIIELLEQTSPIQTGLGTISVYTNDISGQTDQIALGYQGNGQQIQFTNYQIYSLGPSSTQTRFFTFLPGKILVYFGSFFPQLPPKNVLDLTPYVAKNIITVSFCPINTANVYKPQVTLLAPQNGIYKGINVFSAQNVVAAPPVYYFVMANI